MMGNKSLHNKTRPDVVVLYKPLGSRVYSEVVTIEVGLSCTENQLSQEYLRRHCHR